jgi:hypothetical protein
MKRAVLGVAAFSAMIGGAEPLLAQRAAQTTDARLDPAPAAELEHSRWLVPSAHALGLMLTMRVGAAIIWPDPFADVSWKRLSQSYSAAYSQPPKWDGSQRAFEWDGDPWPVNVVGHGLFGSELFMRARTCRHGIPVSFLFTTLGSAVWEYGVEASAVRPSALDLWYTPVAGALLGELRFLGWNAARGLQRRGLRRTLMIVFDPLGELERAAGTPC